MCNLSTGVYNKGYHSGYDFGYDSGYHSGYNSGYDAGYHSGYNSGYDAGYDSGISAGKIKKARETAYELQDMGMPVENIAKAVKVNIHTVQEWLAEREEMLVK